MPKKVRSRPILTAQVKNLIPIPFVNQATDYTCGVAAMLSVLCYWRKSEDDYESDLAKKLEANDVDGVLSKRIIRFARSYPHNFHAYKKKRMCLTQLKSYISKGQPVIVLMQAWRDSGRKKWKKRWDDGHFAVAIGYDDENIYFMDPSTTANYTYIPIEEFLDRWHDWDGDEKVHNLGIVIWKKGRPEFRDQVIRRMC